MSVTAADIKIKCAANQPEDDSSTGGGGISTSAEMIFDSYVLANAPGTSGDGTLRHSSTNNADNGVNIVVYGRNSEGSLVQETGTFGNSGVLDTGTQVFERILKVTSDAHNYDVEIQDSTGNVILTMNSGITTVRRPFYNVSSSPSEDKTYYDKFFVLNNHATLALLNASFIESSDPMSKIAFALSDEINDSDTFTNRLTQPTSTGTDFNSSTKTLSDAVGISDLSPGSGIGVYLELTLASGSSAQKSYWTLGVSGESI